MEVNGQLDLAQFDSLIQTTVDPLHGLTCTLVASMWVLKAIQETLPCLAPTLCVDICDLRFLIPLSSFRPELVPI